MTLDFRVIDCVTVMHTNENQREGKLTPYRDEVIRLRIDGVTYKEIHKIIKAKGYSETQDAIRGFITKEQRIHRDLSQFSENGDQITNARWMCTGRTGIRCGARSFTTKTPPPNKQ